MFAKLRKDSLVAVDLAQLHTLLAAQSQASSPLIPLQAVVSSPKRTRAPRHDDPTPSSSSHHPPLPFSACQTSKPSSKTAPTSHRITLPFPNPPVPTVSRSHASSTPSTTRPRLVPSTNHRPRAAAPYLSSSTALQTSNLSTGTMSSPCSLRVRHGNSNRTNGHRHRNCSTMQRVSMLAGEEKKCPVTSRAGVVVCAHLRWNAGMRRARLRMRMRLGRVDEPDGGTERLWRGYGVRLRKA